MSNAARLRQIKWLSHITVVTPDLPKMKLGPSDWEQVKFLIGNNDAHN